MRREVEEHANKKDSDPSAYKEWDADYKSGKAGKGKKIETKPSKYTKKYKEMFGESEENGLSSGIIRFEDFSDQLNQED